MKNIIYASILLLFSITCSRDLSAQDRIDKKEAYKIILTENLVDTLKDNVEYSNKIIHPNSVLRFMNDSIISPNYNSWFFLIDLEPFSDWTHPCRYVFVNTYSGELKIIEGNKGASFPTKRLLFQEYPKTDIPLPPIFNDKKKLKSTNVSFNNDYAILLSGGYDKSNNNIRYWNNLSLVYKLLLEKGYKKENIYVISADGTDSKDDLNFTNSSGNLDYKTQDLDLDGDGTNDIAYAAKKKDITKVFTEVGHKVLWGMDQYQFSNVFIYTTDHGGIVNGTKDVYLYLWGETMTPTEFFVETGRLQSATSVQIMMDQCHSGGFSDNFKQFNAFITTSCAYNETAKSILDQNGIFLLHWLEGIRGIKNGSTDISSTVDTNSDGILSFSEASDYAKKQVSKYTMTPQFTSNPTFLGEVFAIDQINEPEFYNKAQNSSNYTLKVENIGATVFKLKVQGGGIGDYSYLWQMGDGTNYETKSNIYTHYYECSSKQSFNYNARVTIKNSGGESIGVLYHKFNIPKSTEVGSNGAAPNLIYDVSYVQYRPGWNTPSMLIPFFETSSPFEEIGFVNIHNKRLEVGGLPGHNSFNQTYYTEHCTLPIAKDDRKMLYRGLGRKFYLNVFLNGPNGYYDGRTELIIEAYNLAGRKNGTKILEFIGVNCNESITDSNIMDCKNYYKNRTYNFWSGQFNLNSIGGSFKISDDNYIINACNSIKLGPGCRIKPQPGRSVVFRIEEDILRETPVESSYLKTSVIPVEEIDETGVSFYDDEFNLDDIKQLQKDRFQNNPIKIPSSIYPNPSQHNATLSIGSINNPREIKILDTSGKLKMSILFNENKVIPINLDKLLPAVYIINIIGEDSTETLKFIKL